VTGSERIGDLDELNELFEMMWKDALTLLTDLTEGITAFTYAAFLHFFIGILLLMVDSVFIAMGRVKASDIPSLVGALGIAIVAGVMFYTGWGLRRQYTLLESKYSRMIAAARKFKQYER
jgi:hypothetical protein